MNAKLMTAVALGFAAGLSQADYDYDFGADLRVREELMQNVPWLPGGGTISSSAPRSKFRNHMRFRPDVWGEFRGTTENWGSWRLFAKLTDEFRWNIEGVNNPNANSFPNEVIPDNLFVEGLGLFDGLLDLTVGRQNIYNYCGLDHIFIDGTPGDGSRTLYSDMARAKFHVSEDSTLDLFGLVNFDEAHDIRWGTDRSKHQSLSGFGAGEPDMDDWGFGAIWGSKLAQWLPYQLFVIQKNTHEFKDRRGNEHPWTQRELIGFKTVPQLTEEWALQFEGMSQVGCNGEGDTLSGWSGYAGVNWKKSTESRIKPYANFGLHYMSGDDDAASEDGGHDAWDPMWYRGVNDSEMFLYGSLYGVGWISNMYNVKLTAGVELGPRHKVQLMTGPMFAAAQDGLGGGDGMFKGYLTQGKYEFPLMLADKTQGERFELFGHLLAEYFNPGDYFETEKPAFFIRWQLEFRF